MHSSYIATKGGGLRPLCRTLRGYVVMWLCGSVAFVATQLAIWLCCYVAMWRCGYSELFAPRPAGGRLLMSWSYMYRRQNSAMCSPVLSEHLCNVCWLQSFQGNLENSWTHVVGDLDLFCGWDRDRCRSVALCCIFVDGFGFALAH